MLKRLAAVALGLWIALSLSPPAQAAESPAEAAGDWLAVLVVQPGAELRIALRIRATPQGGYTAEWDSPDQGLYDQAATDVTVAGDNLTFKVPSLAASYAAKWDPKGRRWAGQWTQAGRTFALDFARGVAPPRPVVAGLDGEWNGTLDMGTGLKLRLAFHIRTDARGTFATWDSVDQGVYGAGLSAIERTGERVKLTAMTSGFVIDGQLSSDGKALNAVFTQGQMTLPLVLTRLPPGAPSPWPAPAGPKPTAVRPTDWKPPSDAEIRKILAERIDVQRQGVGIVVGVIDPSGRRVIAHGARQKGDTRPLDGDTVFEIGSITKVFTALTLADMAGRGEVALDDPAVKWMGPGAKMPARNGRQITLTDLATHTSGLPRLPANLALKDMSNPYAAYTFQQLDEFLAGYALTRDPGATWEYSNLAYGLLGNILARRAGTDYESLVKAHVLTPLGMSSTSITLSPDQRARLAIGHDSSLSPVGPWDLPTLAGAGALRSTANDLLSFLAANMGLTDTPLKAGMATLLTVERPSSAAGMTQALGWEVIKTPGGDIIQHGGGTGGYHTLIAFNPKTRVGVVMLTNAQTVMGGDDIAMHILAGTPVLALPPPPPPPLVRKAVAVDAKVLDGYVGSYQLAPTVIVDVTRQGDHLFAQLTGQEPFEIFAEGPRDFFWKVVDAQATFQVGADGKATGLILHQNGRDMPAPRIP